MVSNISRRLVAGPQPLDSQKTLQGFIWPFQNDLDVPHATKAMSAHASTGLARRCRSVKF